MEARVRELDCSTVSSANMNIPKMPGYTGEACCCSDF